MSDPYGSIATVAQDPYASISTPANSNIPAPKTAPVAAPVNTYADVVKSAASGLKQGAAAIAGLPGDVAQGMQWLADKAGLPPMDPQNARDMALLGSGNINKRIQEVTGPYYEPKTPPGHYVERIASFAPAALGGEGSLAVRAAKTVIPAVTSRGAQDLAQGTPYEGAAAVGGALVGAAVGNPLATGAIRSINAAAVGKGLPPILDPVATAQGKLSAAIANDGGTDAAGRQIAAYQGSGASNPALIDVTGNNTRRLVRAAASGGSGEAQNIATGYAGRVRANFQDTVLDHTAGLTPGTSDSAATYAGKLAQAQKDTATTNYGAVKGQPVTMTPEALAALRGNPGSDAIAKAMEDAEANQDHGTIAELQKLQVADLDQPPTISATTLEAVRHAMGEIGAGKAAVPGNKYAAGGYFGRKAGLDTALDATPGLKPARAAYAQQQAGRDAVDVGGGILSTPSSDYASQVAALAAKGGPPNLGLPLQVGARQALTNRLEVGADGATGPAKTLSQSSRATQNLAQTFGEARAGRYQTALGHEVSRVQNADFISPNTGSQTALRTGDESLAASIPTSKVEFLGKIIDTLRGRGATLTDAERAAIVRIGTSEANLRQLAARNPRLNSAAIAQIAASNSGQGN